MRRKTAPIAPDAAEAAGASPSSPLLARLGGMEHGFGMSDRAETTDVVPPDVSHLVTEDDAPVDGLFQEKSMRLLVEPLYSSWRPLYPSGEPRPFMAAADVGIFATANERAIAPDVLFSIDAQVPEECWRKERRSYYLWLFGKPPDVVIEIVSNREGDELGEKRVRYSRLRIAHYVVYDPRKLLSDSSLSVFELRGDLLVASSELRFPTLGLGLTLWEGEFEGNWAPWLRWCDLDGNVILSGAERAEQERERAEQEHERAERLAARLRELGVDEPE